MTKKYTNPVEHAMAMVFAEFKMFDIRANDETLPMKAAFSCWTCVG